MQSEAKICRKLFRGVDTGIFDYIHLSKKPDLDYVKLTCKKDYCWVLITEAVMEKDFRWKCQFIKESPSENISHGFTMAVKYKDQ